MKIERTDDQIKYDAKCGKIMFYWYLAAVAALLIVYFTLHAFFPAENIRPAGLTPDIAKAEVIATAMTVNTTTIQAQLKSAQKDLALDTSKSAVLDKTQENLLADARLQQQKNLDAALTAMAATIKASDWPNQEKLNAIINDLKAENLKLQPDAAVLGVYLKNLKTEASNSSDKYFWSVGWWRWLELLFWAILGTLIYVLWNLQTFLKTSPVGEFSNMRWWYFSTTLQGPFVAILILMAFSTIDLNILNIGLKSSTLPILGWMFLAAVLGYYNRAALKELKIIFTGIFPKAMKEAETVFVSDAEPTIEPASAFVAFGETKKFKIKSGKAVLWSIVPNDCGIIKDGEYKAPAAGTPASAVQGTKVTILATTKEAPIQTFHAQATLYTDFKIVEDTSTGSLKNAYKTSEAVDGDVSWSIDKTWVEIKDGVLKAKGTPAPEELQQDIIITATRKKDPKVAKTLAVKYKP